MGQRKISLVWTGDEKLRLRITITAWWDKLRAWKLAELLLERLEGQPRAVDDVTMSRRGGAPLPPEGLLVGDPQTARREPPPRPLRQMMMSIHGCFGG